MDEKLPEGWVVLDSNAGSYMYDPDGEYANKDESEWETSPPMVISSDRGGYNYYTAGSDYPSGSITLEEVKLESDEGTDDDEVQQIALESAMDLALE